MEYGGGGIFISKVEARHKEEPADRLLTLFKWNYIWDTKRYHPVVEIYIGNVEGQIFYKTIALINPLSPYKMIIKLP